MTRWPSWFLSSSDLMAIQVYSPLKSLLLLVTLQESKHGNGKSPKNGGFNRKIIYTDIYIYMYGDYWSQSPCGSVTSKFASSDHSPKVVFLHICPENGEGKNWSMPLRCAFSCGFHLWIPVIHWPCRSGQKMPWQKGAETCRLVTKCRKIGKFHGVPSYWSDGRKIMINHRLYKVGPPSYKLVYKPH